MIIGVASRCSLVRLFQGAFLDFFQGMRAAPRDGVRIVDLPGKRLFAWSTNHMSCSALRLIVRRVSFSAGHPRLRTAVDAFVQNARGVVFVLDGVNSAFHRTLHFLGRVMPPPLSRLSRRCGLQRVIILSISNPLP